jgi:DNA-binding response OmpR family regulator
VCTTFWFDLPLATLGRRADLAAAPEAAPHRVLLVEDDKDLADLLQVRLAHEGFDVVHAAGVAEARERLRDSPPSVMVVDVVLGDGDGLALVAERRLADPPLTAPVVVLSGHEADEATVRRLGVEWLLKPCDDRELAGAIRRAVRPPGPPRVLVVDGDEAARTVLAAQLATLGVVCTGAADGAGALRLARALAPDLIVLDPALPEMDGYELVRRLRYEQARSTPLLVHGVRALGAAEKRTLALGPTRHLVKARATEADVIRAARELLSAFALPTA